MAGPRTSIRNLRGLHLAALLAVTPLAASAQAGTPPDDSPTGRLKTVVRATSASIAAHRAALDVALARRAAAGYAGPATLDAEIEEVPSGANVVGAQSLRVGVSHNFLPRAQLAAERVLADRDVERARLEVQVAERSLDASVDQLIARASGAAAIATRLAAEDSLLIGAEEGLRTRFVVGDARYVDVLHVRTERLTIQSELQRTRTEARVARRQLVRLAAGGAGEAPSEVAALADSAILAEALRIGRGILPAAPSVDSLLTQSGAVRLAELAVERAEAARQLTVASQRPTISASLGVQRFKAEGSGFSLGPALAASITLPFTARRANTAQRLAAEREVSLARAEREATVTRVATALASAHDRYETARAQLASYDAALLRGAREEREAALAAYRTGTLSLIELLDFERSLARAEISRVRSRIYAADALLDLLTTVLGEDSHDNREPPPTTRREAER